MNFSPPPCDCLCLPDPGLQHYLRVWKCCSCLPCKTPLLPCEFSFVCPSCVWTVQAGELSYSNAEWRRDK